MDIFEMTLNDASLISDNLQKDFDDFWNINILKQEILSEDTKYIVLKDNNDILGFAGIWISPVDVQIMNIVIRKDKRGQGLGKLLLNELIKLAKETGFEILTLEVNENNLPAGMLYEKLGFEVVRNKKKLL